MNVQRSNRFDADLVRQFRWYLLETGLDPVDGVKLATRFADAVEAGLDLLRKNAQIGRRRFLSSPGLEGVRSWRVPKPFGRFVIFYRIAGGMLYAERLLEGHTRLAGGR